MGNRAVITTPERKVGLYLHWNGGRDTVAPLLRYCELKGYRPPSSDEYGWARMCQVMGNFLGGTTSIGIGAYSSDELMDPGDNGIYVIEGWKIIERVTCDGFEEQDEHDFGEMLRGLDSSMPERERLGEYLDSIEVNIEDVRIGDEVWFRGIDDSFTARRVAGLAECSAPGCSGRQLPYVELYDHGGDWTWNANNFVRTPTCRIKPRA